MRALPSFRGVTKTLILRVLAATLLLSIESDCLSGHYTGSCHGSYQLSHGRVMVSRWHAGPRYSWPFDPSPFTASWGHVTIPVSAITASCSIELDCQAGHYTEDLLGVTNPDEGGFSLGGRFDLKP